MPSVTIIHLFLGVLSLSALAATDKSVFCISSIHNCEYTSGSLDFGKDASEAHFDAGDFGAWKFKSQAGPAYCSGPVCAGNLHCKVTYKQCKAVGTGDKAKYEFDKNGDEYVADSSSPVVCIPPKSKDCSAVRASDCANDSNVEPGKNVVVPFVINDPKGETGADK